MDHRADVEETGFTAEENELLYLRRRVRELEAKGLGFAYFRSVNVERAKTFPSAKQGWTPADWMTALVGEVGELANLMKKLRRGVDYTRGQSMDDIRAQFAGEIGDVQTYLDLLAHSLDVDTGTATIAKFNEVSKRVGSPLVLE